MAAVALCVGAVSALDHAGWFGYRGEDRTRYHGAVATVSAVIDGERIEVDLRDAEDATTIIRLRGVRSMAAPDPADGGVSGDEAARFLSEAALHRGVRLALDPNRPPRDGSGQVSAYVFLEESGRLVNESLIQDGLADADRRVEHVMRHRFVELADKAVKGRIGRWGTGVIGPPATEATSASN